VACFPATAASTGAKKHPSPHPHPCRPSSQRQTIASPFQLCTYSCGRAAQVEPQLLEQFFPHRGTRALSSALPHQLAKHSTSARTAPTARSCTHTTAPNQPNPTASTQGTGTTYYTVRK